MNFKLLSNIAGKGFVALLMLSSLPWLVEAVGPKGYGLIGIYTSVQTILMLFDAGISAGYTRRISGIDTKNESDLFSQILAKYLYLFLKVASVIFITSALAFFYFTYEQYGSGYALPLFMALSVALQFMHIYYQATLSTSGHQVQFNVMYVIFGTLRYPILTSMIALQNMDMASYFSLVTLFSLIYWIMLHTTLVRKIKIDFRRLLLKGSRADRNTDNSSSFNKMMFILILTSSILYQSDKLILSKLSTPEILGFYSLAFTVASFPMIFSSSFYYYLFPKLVSLSIAMNTIDFKREFLNNAVLMISGIGSVCIYVSYFSSDLLSIWLKSENYAREAGDILKYLILGSLIQGILMIPYCAQLALGRLKYIVNLNLILGTCLIISQFTAVLFYDPSTLAKCWLAYNVLLLILIAAKIKTVANLDSKVSWISFGIIIPILTIYAQVRLTDIIIDYYSADKIVIIIISGAISVFISGLYAYIFLKKNNASAV